MKKILTFIILLFLFIQKTYASTNTAESYILMDMNTNRVLLSKNKDNPMLIASITKIMTSIIVIENTDLSNIITVDDSILKAYGSGIYIQIGEEMTVKDMLYGLMLRSGNDAAVMLATYISNSEEEFVKLMNDKAVSLGMRNTHFNNASGLDEKNGNYSTSYDMALLTSYAMKNETYKEIVKTKKYTSKTNYKTYIWTNKNKLLNYDYITGGKTGYTEKAKRTLVSTASINNMNLVVVTLKDSDDWNTHTSLYNYAKENYTSYKVLNKSKFNIEEDNYFKGNLIIKNDVYIPFKKEETSSLISHIKLYKLKNYKDNDVVGVNQILYKGKVIYEENIYIELKDIKKESLLDKIRRLFK